MHTRPIASLIWLLVSAILGLIPLHAAHGAILTWNKLAQGESIVFKFDSALPGVEPRQRGLTQIQIPVPWSFWKNERKPVIPDLFSSELFKEILINPDGIFIQTRSSDFILSSSADPKRKELTIELYPPAPYEPENPDPGTPEPTPGGNETATDVNATPETSPPPEQATQSDLAENSTLQAPATPNWSAASNPGNGVGTDQPDLPAQNSSLSGLSAVRSKIFRPGQHEAPSSALEDSTQSVLRLPIDRNATSPDFVRETPPRDETQTNAGAPVQILPATVPATATKAEQNEGPLTEQEEGKEPVTAAANQTGELPDTNQTGIASAVPVAAVATETTGNETVSTAPSEVTLSETILSEPQMPGDAPANQTMNASEGEAQDNSTAELEELYKTAQTALIAEDLKTARAAVTQMIEHPKCPEPLYEELLYTLADITMKEGLEDLEGNFASILEAYEAAKNSNLDSRNVPEAISRMGYLHLFVGNVPEAKGYFDLLRRKYPDDRRVAMIDYYWGEHYLRQKDYGRAAEHFQYSIQNFPMSLAVQPSTVGLLRAFTGLGYFDKALEVVNSIERRWPSYYLSDPSFLMSAGYAAMLSGNLPRAKDYFWAYANIVPDAQDVDVAMARIGDILLKENNPDAAREIYHRTSEAYPAREGGLIAKMRLAEEGVLDQPSSADMNPVFSRPESNPEQIYNSILEHADSSLAPVARLKLAMWHLWNKKYAASLEEIRRFQDDYPRHELLPKAREVADTALRDWITNDLELEDYKGAVLHWSAHENLYQDRDMDPKIRLIVATSFMQTGRPQEALDMARPFVFGSVPRGEFSEPGLELTLAMQVELQQWQDILDLSKQVASWNLTPERQRQLDYATALAHEKLEQSVRARPLWTKLATDMDLTDTQRGYAHYFLGREALGAGKLEQAIILGQEALSLLQKEKSDVPKLKETLELLIQAAEKGGSAQDALAWTLEYDGYVAESDPDWPAHTYRKAMLFKKNSKTDQWRENLNRLKELFPNSLHGRMAAAELEGTRLEREVQKFR